MSKPKELNFFIEERNWPRGVDWYQAHFDADARVRGEASPNYTAFPQHQGVPERMASVVPDAKLIYMVRDPLERIAAHWVHNYAKRREKGTLAETLTHPNTSYVTRSKYAMQLERFLAHYPKEQRPRLPAVRAAPRAHGDAAPDLRVHRRRPGLSPSALRARAPPDLGQDAGDAARRQAREAGPQPPRADASRPTSGWCSTTACPCDGRSSAPTCAPRCRPTTLAELRADGERLRELTGRDFSNWSIWDA